MEGLRIIGLCILASIVFGVVHDLCSVLVCWQYLGVYHPPIGTQSPLLLAVCWGFLATWWFGAASGVVLTVSMRIGAMPRLSWSQLTRPLIVALVWILGLGLATCWTVYWVAGIGVPQPEKEFDRRLVATAVMHSQSYLLSAVATIVLSVWALVKRVRMERIPRASAPSP